MKSSTPDSSTASPGLAAEETGEVCIQYTAALSPLPPHTVPLLHHGLQSFRNLPVWHFFTLSYPAFAQGATTLAAGPSYATGATWNGSQCPMSRHSSERLLQHLGILHLVQSKISESTYIKVRKIQKKCQSNTKYYILVRYALV